ncbi:class I SAM-dependent methyltransferase [Ancylobacter sp. A5.8]|uniref:class I SAM-dependent DNA methyltransferase n=1 Tax=Ancylobacter gelatini TaxID=2919920 RepID=UPI001F4DA0EE|nr:class I SAM-dependent methyltransferase [Ancylobacter gelatini]MCJ8144818.1 class I SAM-dependent methyltransferase [Ancylobacter gelatini]
MTSPADDVVALYERHAHEWDRTGGRRKAEAIWLDRFIAALPKPGAEIIDLGCGSGEPVARYLIDKGCRLTGLDASPTLLGLCRRRLPTHSWIEGDMRQLALGRRFDGLLAWNSFFHLPPDDQRPMFRIFRDHAAPGAALMFTSGPGHGEAIGRFGGDALYHGSLDPADYRGLLAQNGFTVLAQRVEDPECGGLTVWLARLS